MLILPQSIFQGFTVLFSCEPIIYTLSIMGLSFIIYAFRHCIDW